MRGLTYLALATTSLFVISSTGAHAQALAPSELHLTSPEQETKKDIVQVITKEKSPEQKTKKDIAQATTKEPVPVITKKSAQVIAKEKSLKQETKTDAVQVITKEPAHMITKEKSPEQKTKKNIAQAATKEPAPVITKKSAQVMTKKPVQAIAKESVRAFAAEPVRPMDQQSTSTPTRPAFHFSFKTPEGKKESAPVIAQYYPKQIVYPFAKIDRHLDRKLMQAATIAQERAHAHSRSRCWHYVKEALLASGVIDSRPKSELAKEAAQDLVSNYGFKRLSVSDPFAAPVGSVLVYGANRAAGHVEIRTRDGFVSDFRSKTPSPRPLLGVYAKL
ncbi:MAG: hypothetical protein E6L07_04455 [Verrucomicrobia bacterium]|nr:MAG: hypothetical protein E6L07_04455 [Verrucomicrobiota bacterium]